MLRSLFGSEMCIRDGLEEAWRVGHTPASIAEDGVHPTIAGHRLIADTWLDAFATIDRTKG